MLKNGVGDLLFRNQEQLDNVDNVGTGKQRRVSKRHCHLGDLEEDSKNDPSVEKVQDTQGMVPILSTRIRKSEILPLYLGAG
jgi:hypothetical protein